MKWGRMDVAEGRRGYPCGAVVDKPKTVISYLHTSEKEMVCNQNLCFPAGRL